MQGGCTIAEPGDAELSGQRFLGASKRLRSGPRPRSRGPAEHFNVCNKLTLTIYTKLRIFRPGASEQK